MFPVRIGALYESISNEYHKHLLTTSDAQQTLDGRQTNANFTSKSDLS